MDAAIKQFILDKLHQTETVHDVIIPHAIESGSRGWGFAATNADYDCRFICIHRRDRYLSVFEMAEFIEYEVDETYDIKGYDLKRVLKYIIKSQAVINEWLSSNTIYIYNLLAKANPNTMELLGVDEDFANEFQKKFHEAVELTQLPYEPDFVAIDRLLIEIYEMCL